ncbi:GDSL esterase/lipase EXL3-like [Hordeum vulgare subsp. vulgare]|uniref:GDSL esterase/lipase EXL3 n=1 Tax=Hordeum vulgare subsp. vulgare TaxID=112509 RepID=A0A8I6XQ96_HORVV|nr:GDSL esterase/lipase EXL3-like [Hordeum vulgare subsp. vulgare]
MHTSTAMRRTCRTALVAAAVVVVALATAPAVCESQTTKQQQQQQKKKGPLVTAVIVFGDSIMDPGNNNGLHTLVKANHAPYGKDFANHEPTGRFSNGLIPTDFMAQGLNVKQLLPPYLGVEHTPEDLLTGVSFASGATGFDPLTPIIVNVISLEQQLAYFDEYRGKLVGIAGEEGTRRVIDGALFVVCAGTDDIANTYYTTPFRSAHYDVPAYVDLLLVGVESFLRNVSARGAKRVGFVGLPPIGCVPSQRAMGGGGGCVAERNAAARLYNARVQGLIRRLGEEDPAGFPTLVYIDIYTVIQDLVDNGARYGFSETKKGCCGTGTAEVAVLCDARFLPVCDDVSEHVFFDSYHPTQRAYKVIVDYIFDHYLRFLNL